MTDELVDNLEISFGTAILSELVGEPLTRKGQCVRLFDQTNHSAESFGVDGRGKPFIKNHQSGECWFPLTAYRQAYDLDYKTARSYLCKQFNVDETAYQESYSQPVRRVSSKLVTTQKAVDYLPVELYEASRTQFEQNGLYEYLRFTFGQSAADESFTRYRLGTSKRWQHLGYLATSLPQFDIQGNLRQVKIIPYDAMNGRRIKKHEQAETWDYKTNQYLPTEADTDKSYFAGKQMARAVGVTDPNLKQCFFGERLLSEYPGQAVSIVEGESTAIVASIFYPEIIWLSTGGKNGVRWTDPQTFAVLKGRDVVFWPDVDAHEDWSQKAGLLRSLVRSLSVTDYVKMNAPSSMPKADLRDLLLCPRWTLADGSTIYGEPL